MKKRFLAMFMALVVSLTMVTPMLAVDKPVRSLTEAEEAYLSQVDYDLAMEVTAHLTDEIGARYAGSFRTRAAAEYIHSQFEAIGYEGNYHEGDLCGIGGTPRTYSNGSLVINGVDYMYYGPTTNANTVYKFAGVNYKDGGLTKSATGIVLVNWDDVSTDLVLPEGNYADKVVVVLNNSPANVPVVSTTGGNTSGTGAKAPNATRYYNAALAVQNAGAAAVVFETPEPAAEYYMADGTYVPAGNTSYSRIGNTAPAENRPDITIPVGLTLYNETHSLFAGTAANRLASTQVDITMETNSNIINVWAEKKAAEPTDKTVYVTAHYDSQFSGPGANDNASGVGGVIAMAKALKDVETEYNVRFILFDGEELGLYGAYQYVEDMTDVEREGFVANYNLDMMAVSQENVDVLMLNVPDVNRLKAFTDTMTTGESLLDIPEAVAILQEYEVFNNYIYAVQRTGRLDTDHYSVTPANSSDHRTFFNEATRRAAEGKEFPNMTNVCHYDWRKHLRGYPNSGVFEELYHKVGDTMENVSRERLEICVELSALGIAYSANVKGIEGPESSFGLLSDKSLVVAEDTITLSPVFWSNIGSNAAEFTLTYDKDRFEFTGFTAAGEVQVVNQEETETGVEITVISKDYLMDTLGDATFAVKSDLPVGNNHFTAEIDYVVKDEQGQKVIKSAAASTSVISTLLNPEDVDLITLSNLTDMFGVDFTDPEWVEYRLFDFNSSGNIDIYDICYVAKLV